MVNQSGHLDKHVPIDKAVAEGIDFCSNSLYPQARQALPHQQELHCCLTTLRHGHQPERSPPRAERSVQQAKIP